MSKTIGFKTPLPKAEADAFVAKGKETYTEPEVTGQTKRLTIDVPESLHRSLKLKAIDEGCTIRDLVTLWLQDRINKSKQA